MTIKNSDKVLFIIYLIMLVGSLTTVIYFSIQFNNNIKINNQYSKYNSNITNYNIVKEIYYYGFIELKSLSSNHNCSIYVDSESSKSKLNGYLEYNYPLYTFVNIYYSVNDCLFSLPKTPYNDLGLVIGFLFISLLLSFTIIGFGYYMINNRKSEVKS
jgi:hypothetical protein